MAKDVMSTKELAQYLGVAEITVYRLAKAGKIPGGKVGKIWRFPKDLVDEWLRAGGYSGKEHKPKA